MKIPLLFLLILTTTLQAAWQTSNHVTVWTKYPSKQRTFSWSGTTDAEGKATGPGTYTVYFAGKKIAIYTGTMTAGVMAGQVEAVYPQKGLHYSGEMQEGSENGQGTMILADGTTQAGRWVDGVLVEPAVEKAIPIAPAEQVGHGEGPSDRPKEGFKPYRGPRSDSPVVVEKSAVPSSKLYGVFSEDPPQPADANRVQSPEELNRIVVDADANPVLAEAEAALIQEDYSVSGKKARLVVDLLDPPGPDHITAWARAQAVIAGTYTGIGVEIESKKGPNKADCYRKSLRAVEAGIPENQALRDRLKQQSPDIYARLLEEKGRAEFNLRDAPGSSSRDTLKCCMNAFEDWDEALKTCRNDLEAAEIHRLLSRACFLLSNDGFDPKNNDATALSEAEKALELSTGRNDGRLIWAKCLYAHAWAIVEMSIHGGIQSWNHPVIQKARNEFFEACTIVRQEVPHSATRRTMEEGLAYISKGVQDENFNSAMNFLNGILGNGQSARDEREDNYQRGLMYMEQKQMNEQKAASEARR